MNGYEIEYRAMMVGTYKMIIAGVDSIDDALIYFRQHGGEEVVSIKESPPVRVAGK